MLCRIPTCKRRNRPTHLPGSIIAEVAAAASPQCNPGAPRRCRRISTTCCRSASTMTSRCGAPLLAAHVCILVLCWMCCDVHTYSACVLSAFPRCCTLQGSSLRVQTSPQAAPRRNCHISCCSLLVVDAASTITAKRLVVGGTAARMWCSELPAHLLGPWVWHTSPCAANEQVGKPCALQIGTGGSK